MRLTPIEPTRFGIELEMEAASADSEGDSFINDGRIILQVANADDMATRTLTFTPTAAPKGLEITPIEVEIAAEATALIGPFPPRYFNDATGQVFWTYDDESDVTLAAIRVK